MRITLKPAPVPILAKAKPSGGLKLYILTSAKTFVGALVDEKMVQALLRIRPELKVAEKGLKKPTTQSVAGLLLSSSSAASKGGLARSANLTKARKREIALNANKKRWKTK